MNGYVATVDFVHQHMFSGVCTLKTFHYSDNISEQRTLCKCADNVTNKRLVVVVVNVWRISNDTTVAI